MWAIGVLAVLFLFESAPRIGGLVLLLIVLALLLRGKRLGTL